MEGEKTIENLSKWAYWYKDAPIEKEIIDKAQELLTKFQKRIGGWFTLENSVARFNDRGDKLHIEWSDWRYNFDINVEIHDVFVYFYDAYSNLKARSLPLESEDWNNPDFDNLAPEIITAWWRITNPKWNVDGITHERPHRNDYFS